MAYPRGLAIRVLTRVLSDRQPLDEALAAVSGECAPADRAWLQEVCAGTLRWKGRLDMALDSAALKKKPSGWLRKAMLIGCYQLIGQERTSPAAVVSETVTEVKKKEGEAPAKFANAILRKVADHAAEWRQMPLRARAPVTEAAAWASLPEWFWKKIAQDHGLEWASAFASAALERPQLWLRAKSADWHPAWASPGPVARSWKVEEAGRLQEKEGFAQGDFIVQDISSQYLIEEVTKEVREALGDGKLTALDLCAAPGGKSIGLAWSGFDVTASDRSDARLELLRQTVQRTGTPVHVLEAGKVAEVADESFDLVWIDAPCMGTGIIRRHPDVRWNRRETELSAVLAVQKDVLAQGWSKVRKGGFLVYSVCSVLKDEGARQIQGSCLGGSLVQEWNLAPHEGMRGDGFFGALIRR